MAEHAKTDDNAATKTARNRKIAAMVLAACATCVVACGIVYAMYQADLAKAAREAAEAEVPEVVEVVAEEPELLDNPVDFAALRAENPDIYAWITVPNTNVNHPILQHPTDDGFYLDHDKDGELNFAGAIYTELYNSKDFADPVTVVYGHQVKGGLMFASLHEFEDEEFFADNPEFHVYTPGHILTYKVVAAESYDDNHILHGKDYTDEDQFLQYLDKVKSPNTAQSNIREDVELAKDSRILQLSTCNYSSDNERYVVTGVLVDDQPTK